MMDDVYKDIDNYNPKRNKKVLIVLMTCCRYYDK